MADLYRLLKVRRTATPDEITAAYRRLAMQFHPDRNPGDAKAAERFKVIQDAYAVLSDPARRERYDETGDVGEPKTPNHVFMILGDLLVGALRAAASAGVRIQDVDLVAKMRQALANGRQRLRASELPIAAELAAWKATLGRFIVAAGTDGENPLEGIARAHVQRLDGQLQALAAELGQIAEVEEYLRTVKYKTDSPFSGAMDASALGSGGWAEYGKW